MASDVIYGNWGDTVAEALSSVSEAKVEAPKW